MLIGTDAVYSYTFEHEKRNDCPVCGGESLDIVLSKEWTVERLIELLVEKQDMYVDALLSQYQLLTRTLLADKSRNRHSPPPQDKSTSRHPHS